MDKKPNESVPKEEQIQIKSLKKVNDLILTETTLGKLKLEKGIPIKESTIKELFSGFPVLKKLGEQDDPNFFYYDIGSGIQLKTQNLENETLSQVWISEKSNASDEYGIKLGMAYSDIEKSRPNMNISTEHHHIYLYAEDSNIAYEMSLGNYNGPDKEQYSLKDIKNYNSKVASIIWK